MAREAAEAEAARLRRLQAVTAALSGARTPDQVAEVALGEGLRALGGARGFLIVRGDGGATALLRSAGLSEGHARLAFEPAVACPGCEALRRGEPVFASSPAEIAERWPILGADRARALAALPLAARGRVLGALVALHDEPRTQGEADRAYALALASQCAQALDRAGLYVAEKVARAEAVAAQRRLAFLDGLSAHLAAVLDEPDIARGVVELAVPALAEFAGIYLATEGGLALAASAGPALLGEAAVARLGAGPDGGLERATAGEPVIDDEVPVGAGPERLAALAVPLDVAGRSLGALLLVTSEPGRRHSAADLALAGDVARRAALALGHARLLGDAKAAARAREEFLAVASHELRGPIGTLRFAVQLLLRDFRSGASQNPEARLRMIERQADRLVRLGDALLDVSRITSGRLELAREEADLAELAREVSARFQDEAAEARIRIDCDAEAAVPAPIDAARIEQVLSNLLSNAVKYGNGAPVKVSVRAAGGRAFLEVTDGGIGIPEADQARIFGRFERAVSSRNYAGLGLGLWIASRVVEAHGGTIRVTSTPGAGSTFTVELPLAPRG